MARAPRSRWLLLVPNAFSAARFVLAGLFPLTAPAWWPELVIAAGLSDLADGFLARRLGLASWIGGLLDAVSDKAFVLTVLITLTYHGHLSAGQVVTLLARDIVVGSVAGLAVMQRDWTAFRRMPSRALGKTTTAALFALLLVLVLAPPEAPLARITFIVAAAASLAAAVDYFVRFLTAPPPDRSQESGSQTTAGSTRTVSRS